MISIVIPVFNEETNICLMYKRLKTSLKQVLYDHEIIFVNDGSLDDSLETLKRLAEMDRRVKVINLSRNFGHQFALTAGMHEAQGNLCITLDCDLQDPPEIIPELLKKYEEGYNIVYARRSSRSDSFFKKITAKYYYKILASMSNIHIPQNVGDFRLMDRKVLDALNKLPERCRYLRGMVSWVGFRQTFVDFIRPNRVHGETHYTWRKMFQLAADGIMSFSLFPLKLGMYIGLFIMLFGTSSLTYMLFNSIFMDNIYSLNKWLTLILFIFLGFLFILIWIMGEYIGRIYNEEIGRPLYIINDKINFESSINEKNKELKIISYL